MTNHELLIKKHTPAAMSDFFDLLYLTEGNPVEKRGGIL